MSLLLRVLSVLPCFLWWRRCLCMCFALSGACRVVTPLGRSKTWSSQKTCEAGFADSESDTVASNIPSGGNTSAYSASNSFGATDNYEGLSPGQRTSASTADASEEVNTYPAYSFCPSHLTTPNRLPMMLKQLGKKRHLHPDDERPCVELSDGTND